MNAPRPSDISIKAVIVGVIADNAGTLFLMTLLASLLMASGLSGDEVMLRLRSASGLLLGFILGMGCTIGGGYLAGRVACRAEVKHGALVALAGIILMLIFRDGDTPLWFEVLAFSGMLPAGLFGGHLAQKRNYDQKGIASGTKE